MTTNIHNNSWKVKEGKDHPHAYLILHLFNTRNTAEYGGKQYYSAFYTNSELKNVESTPDVDILLGLVFQSTREANLFGVFMRYKKDEEIFYERSEDLFE